MNSIDEAARHRFDEMMVEFANYLTAMGNEVSQSLIKSLNTGKTDRVTYLSGMDFAIRNICTTFNEIRAMNKEVMEHERINEPTGRNESIVDFSALLEPSKPSRRRQ